MPVALRPHTHDIATLEKTTDPPSRNTERGNSCKPQTTIERTIPNQICVDAQREPYTGIHPSELQKIKS